VRVGGIKRFRQRMLISTTREVYSVDKPRAALYKIHNITPTLWGLSVEDGPLQKKKSTHHPEHIQFYRIIVIEPSSGHRVRYLRARIGNWIEEEYRHRIRYDWEFALLFIQDKKKWKTVVQDKSRWPEIFDRQKGVVAEHKEDLIHEHSTWKYQNRHPVDGEVGWFFENELDHKLAPHIPIINLHKLEAKYKAQLLQQSADRTIQPVVLLQVSGTGKWLELVKSGSGIKWQLKTISGWVLDFLLQEVTKVSRDRRHWTFESPASDTTGTSTSTTRLESELTFTMEPKFIISPDKTTEWYYNEIYVDTFPGEPITKAKTTNKAVYHRVSREDMAYYTSGVYTDTDLKTWVSRLNKMAWLTYFGHGNASLDHVGDDALTRRRIKWLWGDTLTQLHQARQAIPKWELTMSAGDNVHPIVTATDIVARLDQCITGMLERIHLDQLQRWGKASRFKAKPQYRKQWPHPGPTFAMGLEWGLSKRSTGIPRTFTEKQPFDDICSRIRLFVMYKPGIWTEVGGGVEHNFVPLGITKGRKLCGHIAFSLDTWTLPRALDSTDFIASYGGMDAAKQNSLAHEIGIWMHNAAATRALIPGLSSAVPTRGVSSVYRVSEYYQFELRRNQHLTQSSEYYFTKDELLARVGDGDRMRQLTQRYMDNLFVSPDKPITTMDRMPTFMWLESLLPQLVQCKYSKDVHTEADFKLRPLTGECPVFNPYTASQHSKHDNPKSWHKYRFALLDTRLDLLAGVYCTKHNPTHLQELSLVEYKFIMETNKPPIINEMKSLEQSIGTAWLLFLATGIRVDRLFVVYVTRRVAKEANIAPRQALSYVVNLDLSNGFPLQNWIKRYLRKLAWSPFSKGVKTIYVNTGGEVDIIENDDKDNKDNTNAYDDNYIKSGIINDALERFTAAVHK
jgi:hypothetical protein